MATVEKTHIFFFYLTLIFLLFFNLDTLQKTFHAMARNIYATRFFISNHVPKGLTLKMA